MRLELFFQRDIIAKKVAHASDRSPMFGVHVFFIPHLDRKFQIISGDNYACIFKHTMIDLQVLPD